MNDRITHNLTHPWHTPQMIRNIHQMINEHAVFTEVFIEQAYRRLIEDLKPNTVAIDIGTCYGESAIYLAMQERISEVYAYELMPSNYAKAKENIRKSSLGGKIELFNMALWDKDGVVHVPKGNGSNSSAVSGSGVEIKCITLERALKGKKNVIIKCDVEGAEERIFANPTGLKEVYRIMLESNTKTAKEKVMESLAKAGFKMRVKPTRLEGNYIYAERR